MQDSHKPNDAHFKECFSKKTAVSGTGKEKTMRNARFLFGYTSRL